MTDLDAAKAARVSAAAKDVSEVLPQFEERLRAKLGTREAGERGGTYPCAFNAANEVAVAAFLAGRLAFLDIAEVVAETLAAVDGAPARDLDELVAADAEARRLVEGALKVA